MPHFGLGAREQQLVELLARGNRETEAAQIMGITPNTARTMRQSACRKLGVYTGTQLAIRWIIHTKLKRAYHAGYNQGWHDAKTAWETAWKR